MSGAGGWIGVDLDGTLAVYDGWKYPAHIGEPVPAMVERVKQWLADGLQVRVFTARVWHDGSAARALEAEAARIAVEKWCLKHLGTRLTVTNIKDYAMIELWDDRCVAVEPNTGRKLSESTKGL